MSAAAFPLAVLLDRLGLVEPSSDEAGASGPQALTAALRARGREARAVRVSAETVARLPLPTVVALRADTDQVAILSRVSPRRATLELADGSVRRVPRARLESLLGDWALDLSTPLPREGGFLRRLAHAFAAQRGRLGALALLSLPAQGLELLAPLATQVAMDRALPDGASSMLGVLALGLVALSLHRAGIGWVRATVQRHLGTALEVSVLRGLFGHALRLPYRELGRLTVGELSQTLGAGASTSALGLRLTLLPIDDGVLALLSLVPLLLVAPATAALLVVLSSLSVGASAALSVWHARLQAAELRASAREQSYLAQVITGAPTIRAMAAGPAVVSRWLRRLVDEQAASLRRLRLVLWLDVVCDGTQDLLGVGLLIWGASRCLAGELSLGALMSLVMWGNGLVAALMRFGNALFQMSGNAPAFRRADDLLARPIEPPPPPDLPPSAAPGLVVQDVWFRYGPQEPWVVRAQSLEVRPGERLCLKGRSGTGKSTLLRLMAGLCTPDRGSIRIDGRPAEETRAQVSYLPQDAYLFEGSIATNLRLLSGASPARIAEAARRTGLEGWIAALPMGHDTPISAGGQNISGGERQLVVLTAAVAADRPVVLLDEATAHLDRLTRARLHEAGLFAGKTVVEIVHDDAGDATGPE